VRKVKHHSVYRCTSKGADLVVINSLYIIALLIYTKRLVQPSLYYSDNILLLNVYFVVGISQFLIFV